MSHISIKSDYCPEVLIVAHGALESDDTMCRLVKEAEHVVLCDGALESYTSLFHRQPDVVVGDGDSVNELLLQELAIEMIRIEEQETNDLSKAVRYATSQGWRSICIVGATGKRDDHAIGNISLMIDYFHADDIDEVRMYSPHGWMIPYNGACTIDLERGRQLSFFAPPTAILTAEGVAYPFKDRQFDRFWKGTLNEALGGTVCFSSTESALIFIANQIKERR